MSLKLKVLRLDTFTYYRNAYSLADRTLYCWRQYDWLL